MEIKTTPEKITFKSESGIKTNIIPSSDVSKLVTKTASQIQETGVPSNKELDELGDKIWEIIESSKKHFQDPKVEKIAEGTQKIVGDLKEVVKEKNYDEKLQEIVRKLKEAPRDVVGVASEIQEEAYFMRDRLRATWSSMFELVKAMIRDGQFRDTMVTLLDIFQNSYEEAVEDVSEAVKEDVKDSSNAPRRTQEVFNVDNMRRYVTLSDEEKEEILSKFSATLLKMRKNSQYKEFLENAFKLYDDIVGVWDKVKNTPEFNSVYNDASSVAGDIKELFERSTNRSLDRWIVLLQEIHNAKDDPRFVSARIDLEGLLFDPSNKLQSEEQIKEKYQKIKTELGELNEAYNNFFDELSYESRNLVNGITSDPLIKKMKTDIDNMFREILTDSSGKPSTNIAQDSMVKLRNFFFPILKEKLSFVSLPIIEVITERYFFRVEDFKLHLNEIIPEQLQIDTDSSIKVDLENLSRKGVINFRIAFEPINADIESLKFLLNKKTGLIRYFDFGVVDIYLRDCGIVFYFTVNLEEDKVDKIELARVDSNFDGMKIKIIESKHSILDSIITTVFMPALRFRLKTAIESSLMESLNYGICDQLNYAFSRFYDQDKEKSKS